MTSKKTPAARGSSDELPPGDTCGVGERGSRVERMPRFPTVESVHTCARCKRRIVVSQVLIGVNHTIGIGVVCIECLTPSQKRKLRNRLGVNPSSDL